MQKKRVLNSPTSVQLLLTRKCNLNCIYCSATQYEKNEKEPELSTKEWLEVLKRLKEIQVFTVDFSGGEIFLKEDIFDILETAGRYNFPKMVITSNGTLISDVVAKRLKSLNFKNLAISLDGNLTNHNRLRGDGVFSKTLEGIGHLVNNGIIPQILFTPLKINYKDLNELVEMLYPMGVRDLSFNKLHPTGRCSEIYKDVMLDCFADSGELSKIIGGIREKYCDFNIDEPPMVYQCYPEMYNTDKPNAGDMTTPKLKPCSAAHSSCNITSSGWVIPCSELFDFKGGNIRAQDILAIWRESDVFQKIRNLSTISTTQIPYCRDCGYNVFCSAGCRADAYAVYEDLLAPDPFCPYWKKK